MGYQSLRNWSSESHPQSSAETDREWVLVFLLVLSSLIVQSPEQVFLTLKLCCHISNVIKSLPTGCPQLV